MGNDGFVFEEYVRKNPFTCVHLLLESFMDDSKHYIIFLKKTIDATNHSETDKSHHLSDIKICRTANKEGREKFIANHLKLLI